MKINLRSLRRWPDAAAATSYSEDRARLQKAAAWQWFMHGAGAEAQPLSAAAQASARIRPVTTRSAIPIQKQASRFANEAVKYDAAANCASTAASCDLPIDDSNGLIDSLAVAADISGAVSDYGLSQGNAEPQVEDKCTHLSNDIKQREEVLHFEEEENFSESFGAYPNDKPKRHPHFLGIQKLLRKLTITKANKKTSNLALATMPVREEAGQHHYRHYIHHHHHHHHYYHGAPGSSLEEVDVIKHSYPQYIEHKRTRRHSESSSYNYQPNLMEAYHELLSPSSISRGEENGEGYKFKGDWHAFRRQSLNFSEEELQHPIAAFNRDVEEIVIGQPWHRYPSLPFGPRCNSERFRTPPSMVKLSSNRSQVEYSERRKLAQIRTNYTFE